MHKLGIPIGLVGLLAILFLAACAPAVAPAPAPAPAAAPAPAPKAAPQDATWAKVVQAAKKEDKLTAYSFNFTGDTGLALGKAFKERYGVAVDVVTGRGAAFLERLKTEQRMGQLTADFLDLSTVHVNNAKVAGLTISIADLPVLQEKKEVWLLHPLGVDPEGHVVGYSPIVYTGFVNTSLVKPGEEPKAFADFLEPKWKGKILGQDPNISGTFYTVFVTALTYGMLNLDFIQGLGKQDIRMVEGGVQNARALARGEYPVTIALADLNTTPFVAEGAPIKAIALKEGAVATSIAAAIIKNGPHPNAAKLFMNWLLTQEGQSVFSKAKDMASIRRDVPDFRPAAIRIQPSRLVVLTPKDEEEASKKFREKWLVEMWKK